MDIKKNHFAFSKAGHDKGTIYYIVDSDEKYVYLSDGEYKKTDKLKKKKHKHIQIIANKIEGNLPETNEQIKFAIKQIKKIIQN